MAADDRQRRIAHAHERSVVTPQFGLVRCGLRHRVQPREGRGFGITRDDGHDDRLLVRSQRTAILEEQREALARPGNDFLVAPEAQAADHGAAQALDARRFARAGIPAEPIEYRPEQRTRVSHEGRVTGGATLSVFDGAERASRPGSRHAR